MEVKEGDLLLVAYQGRIRKVRLYGVICPVNGQLFHDQARGLSSLLTGQKKVDITPVFTDGEGAIRALVRIDGTKYYLNERLVGYGMAWVKPAECKATLCKTWRELQGLAQKNAIGLWAYPAEPPWEWAKERKMDIYRRHKASETELKSENDFKLE